MPRASEIPSSCESCRIAKVFGAIIRFSTADFRSGEYPTSASYPAHLTNRGKVEQRTNSLTQGAAHIYPGDDGRANLVATITGSSPGPHLVFCAHCDTVPLGDRNWDHSPFGGAILDGRIYGRGNCDMKGGLAALTASFLNLAAQDPAELQGRLSLAITYGEKLAPKAHASWLQTVVWPHLTR